MNNLPGAAMTLRDEFESWISLPPFEHMCDRNSNKSAWPGAYKRYETELAWEAYQSAHAKQQKRADELEECLGYVMSAWEYDGISDEHGAIAMKADELLISYWKGILEDEQV
jgi:hypothetical protein